MEVDEQAFCLTPFAEQGGMLIYLGESIEDGNIPPSSMRRIIETKITKQTHEHMIIFVDKERENSVWQWVRRQRGKQTASREHTYSKGQPGDSLLQKLVGIAFSIDDLDEEGRLAITEVTGRVAEAFDIEKVTRRFYDEFKKEHSNFSKFLKGLEGQDEFSWYTSVMLDRLMFIYFIQKKGFLDEDIDYLANKLRESKARDTNQFYSRFLVRLFFEGFAKEEKDRSAEVNQLLGTVPYLNGGLFLPHQLEIAYGENINISDSAFERLFAFFDRYSWHLDYRPLRADNEINPDVLGYIFEKYVNQKQMGAYYTKEDITGYICKNTIIPFLFDKLENMRYDELDPFSMKEVEPYIYEVIKQEDYLPTETKQEYEARQKRYQQIKEDFAAGKISNSNDLITYNLDIRKFAEDWARGIKDPVTLRAFYFHCLTKLTVLDPAVGSGAFLFAALNMLEPLYEICLDKMYELGGPKYADFAEELARIKQHPNRKYFVFKSIIVNNLFGVDIMEEAVEICKLRLFLKLVSQIDDVEKIEPLPDIDFNIRGGNSLVGYVNEEEIKKAKATQLDLSGAMKGIEERIRNADRALQSFRGLQTRLGISAPELAKAKAEVKDKLAEIQGELDRDLVAFYGARDIKRFVQTHQPFHWSVEFYSIMKNGGFDVIIGNPPFVSYGKVRLTYTLPSNIYKTEACGNLYAFFLERSFSLLTGAGRFGMIAPVSLVSGETYKSLADITFGTRSWVSTYSNRPGKLFHGVEQRIAIILRSQEDSITLSTYYQHWYEDERDTLMQRLSYCPTILVPSRRMPYKVGSKIGRNILGKILSKSDSLMTFKKPGNFGCWYHDGPTYWIRALPFEPNIGLKSDRSSHYHRISTNTKEDALILSAIISSSTFYYFFKLVSNCRDFGRKELNEYRVSTLPHTLRGQLVDLGQELGDTLQNTAGLCSRDYPSGFVEYEEYYPWKAKHIIDKIDTALARLYDFTEEELDFIINYDIKYRMGKDAEEEEI
jgi:hypothetical protein